MKLDSKQLNKVAINAYSPIVLYLAASLAVGSVVANSSLLNQSVNGVQVYAGASASATLLQKCVLKSNISSSVEVVGTYDKSMNLASTCTTGATASISNNLLCDVLLGVDYYGCYVNTQAWLGTATHQLSSIGVNNEQYVNITSRANLAVGWSAAVAGSVTTTSSATLDKNVQFSLPFPPTILLSSNLINANAINGSSFIYHNYVGGVYAYGIPSDTTPLGGTNSFSSYATGILVDSINLSCAESTNCIVLGTLGVAKNLDGRNTSTLVTAVAPLLVIKNIVGTGSTSTTSTAVLYDTKLINGTGNVLAVTNVAIHETENLLASISCGASIVHAHALIAEIGDIIITSLEYNQLIISTVDYQEIAVKRVA
jgi:hypothetical protein